MDDNELTKIVDGIFRHQPLSHIQRQCLEPFIAGAIRQAHAAGIERAVSLLDGCTGVICEDQNECTCSADTVALAKVVIRAAKEIA